MKINYIYCAIILLLSSCQGIKDREFPESCPIINPLELTSVIDSVHDHIDSIAIVNIDVSKHDIGTAEKIMILDNGDIIILTLKRISRFNKTGEHIINYGSIGRGRGEFLKIYDICLSIDNRELWALNHMGEVLKYDLSSGEYLDKIRYDNKNIMSSDGVVPISNNNFAILSINKDNAFEIDYNYPYLSEYNFDGKYIQKLISWRDFNVKIPSSPAISYAMRKYIIKPQDNDCVYIIENGKIHQHCKIHFGRDNIEPLFCFDGQNTPWMRLNAMLQSDTYKNVMNIQITDNHLFFSALGPKQTQYNYLMNSNLTDGISWVHNTHDVMPFFIIGSDSDFLYGVYTKSNITTPQKSSPMLSYLNDFLSLRNEDVFLIKIKFK